MNSSHLKYYLFLLLSTFTRGLVEVFSLVVLYKKGFSISNIFFFLFIMYLSGIFVNYIALKINAKVVLFLSSILYGISYIYISIMENTSIYLILLAVLLAISNYSYHVVRHLLYCLLLNKDKRDTNKIIIINYIGIILSSLLGIILFKKLNLIIISIILFCLSILSILPIIRINLGKNEKEKISIFKIKIEKKKALFQMFEQFKVLFLEVQPLYVYIKVNSSISYIGIFNIVVNVASFLVILLISKRLNKNYFKYSCVGMCLVFFLKLNTRGELYLLFLAFFEGIFIKIYENFSLRYLYDVEVADIKSYLWKEEFIFFSTKSFIMFIVCIFNISIYNLLFLCIIGIFISNFFYKCELKS